MSYPLPLILAQANLHACFLPTSAPKGETFDMSSSLVLNFFLQQTDVEIQIDIIELLFRKIDLFVRASPGYFALNSINPDEAIDELNSRFKEHGLGYEYAAGQIIRIDSKLLHQEVIKPVLLFLQNAKFKGANEEFLSAHSHFREGKHKECLNDCLKAFESTLKIICGKRKWPFKTTDTAKRLLEIVFEKELIPSFLQSHFIGLRTTLESGIPTVRNKLGGHGQGAESVEVPDYIAGYALHLTAANILLLAKADAEFS